MNKLLPLFLFLPVSVMAQGYCIPDPDSAEIFISKVVINGWQNTSGNDGYTAYFDDTLEVVLGDSVPMSVTTQGSSISLLDDVYVFIDWNRDSTFSNDEAAFFPTHFNVPDSMDTGLVRLRVVAAFHDDQHANPVPCLNDRGEAEDYILRVIDTTSMVMNISAVPDQSVRIYPNPASSQVVVETAQDADVQIHSASGQLVFEGRSTVEGLRINLVKEPVGLYFIHVHSGTQESVHKLIFKP